MPFFLPRRLVDFEYFDNSESDSEYDQIAKNHRKEMDFAFFVVNFGYSKKDYEELTPKERSFIYKAYENKVVGDSSLMSNAVNNAVNNALRKKGKKAVALWKKNTAPVDKEIMQEKIDFMQAHEKKNGKAWVSAVKGVKNG